MKYTKKQRHEIYKKALISAIKYGENCTLCYRMEDVTGLFPYESEFPELFIFKPENVSETGLWFPWNNSFEHRKTVLEFCIYMTK